MILVIVQARMGSTRMPGKSMAPICGVPLVEHVVKRCHASQLANFVCVATTDQPGDDPLAAHVSTLHNTGVYRGSESDVLGRFNNALLLYPSVDVVVRICADDPFVDPALIDYAITAFLSAWAEPDERIGSPSLVELGGPTWALGMGLSVMTRATIEQAAKYATIPEHREHVTPWIAEKYGVWTLKDMQGRASINTRLTLDTPADYSVALRIYEQCYPVSPVFGYEATLAALATIEQAA